MCAMILFTILCSRSEWVGGLEVGAAEGIGAEDDEAVCGCCPVAACGDSGTEPGGAAVVVACAICPGGGGDTAVKSMRGVVANWTSG